MGEVTGPEVKAESFSSRILHQAGIEPRIPSPEGLHRFRYAAGPGQAVRLVPLHQILHTPSWEANYLTNHFFKDKLVIVGPSAEIFHDEHRTPFGENMLVSCLMSSVQQEVTRGCRRRPRGDDGGGRRESNRKTP